MSKTPTPLTELFATLKGYVNQLSAGERTPGEVGSALNDWARDSAESIKAKIHEEVEASVAKMGFVKREEFDALVREVNALKKSGAKKSPVKKNAAKKTAAKKVAKPAKKSVKKGV